MRVYIHEPSGTEDIGGNKKILLHFISFLDTEMVQVQLGTIIR